jgi:hypothetical protein
MVYDSPSDSIIAALPRTSYGKMTGMAKKKRKPKKFSAVGQVKAMARAQIGAPPAGRVVPDRREKKIAKHKPTLGEMLEPE